MGMTMIGWTVRSLKASTPPKKSSAVSAPKLVPAPLSSCTTARKIPDRLLRIVSVAVKEIRAKGLEFDRLDKMLEPA